MVTYKEIVLIITSFGLEPISIGYRWSCHTAAFCICRSNFQITNEKQNFVQNSSTSSLIYRSFSYQVLIWTLACCLLPICSWTQTSLYLTLVNKIVVTPLSYNLQTPVLSRNKTHITIISTEWIHSSYYYRLRYRFLY